MFEDLLDGSASPIMSEEEAQRDMRNLSGPESVVAFVSKVLDGLKYVLQNEVSLLCGLLVYVCLVCVRR
jgi:hypothetical protein